MRTRTLRGLILTGLLLLVPAPVQSQPPVEPPTPFKPAVLVRLKGLEGLISDARYLVKQAGREEEAKQIEALLKARTGPKGLEGVDISKPIGLYAAVNARLDQSQVVLLLPIADEKEFLTFLRNLDLKPEKGADGLYTLSVENIPFPIVFRIENGYLYGSLKFSEKGGLPPKSRLPLPATALAGGSGTLSLTVNIDQIPPQVRKLGVSAMALQLGNLKDEKQEGETRAQEAVRHAILDETAAQIKAVLEDATAARLQFDVDQKKHDVAVSFSLEGRSGSSLAKNIGALAAARSVAAGMMSKESAMGGMLHLVLPQSVRKVLGPVIDEAVKKGLAGLEKEAREVATPLADALVPTARAGTLDMALDLRGPGKTGKYTLVASMRVEKGEEVEKALRRALAKLPEEARKPIHLDADKAEGVNIHRVEQKKVEEGAREMFGAGPLYFAVRSDAVILTLGESALEAMKSALAAKAKPGQPVRVELALARIAQLMGKQDPAAPAAAKKAFKEPGSDKVRLTVEAGDRLEVRLSLKSAVIAFASLLDRARNEVNAPR